jgi:GNAT superfamily N-acetyltransferase
MKPEATDVVLRFTGIDRAGEGVLVSLLRQAYASLLLTDGSRWPREGKAWGAFDHVAFTSAEVGRCVFLTWHGDSLVGFGSFDPRGAPRSARVGHNCIVPAFQGRGFGGLQLQEIMRRLHELAIIDAEAFTLDLPFFLPARRMYQSAGFRLLERTRWSADPDLEVLHFQKNGLTTT